MKRLTSWMAILTIAALPFFGMGCENDAQTGSLVGAGGGAALGAALSHGDRGKGAVVGGLIGALSGYIIGNEQDKKKHKQNY